MAETPQKETRVHEVNPTTTDIHPEGALRLSEGILLKAHARTTPANDKKSKEEEEATMDLFRKNAFLFLQHSERILSDSRMFLAPVHVGNNLAYTGTSGLRNATLGVYIEWWHQYAPAIRAKAGQKWLVWFIAGSPLSGSNHCSMVNPEGCTRTVTLSPFIDAWSSFMKINQRYDSIKSLYEAYSLSQVVDILTKGSTQADTLDIDNFYLGQQCALLREQLDKEKQHADALRDELIDTYIALHEVRLREAVDRYLEMQAGGETRAARLKEERSRWKARLKRGEITNVDYQRAITPINKELSDIPYRLHSFVWDQESTFPEGMTFTRVLAHFAH